MRFLTNDKFEHGIVQIMKTLAMKKLHKEQFFQALEPGRRVSQTIKKYSTKERPQINSEPVKKKEAEMREKMPKNHRRTKSTTPYGCLNPAITGAQKHYVASLYTVKLGKKHQFHAIIKST